MTGDIHGQAMYHLLDREVLKLAKVLCIVFLVDSDGSARASSI
jgi:hypothetical protein